MRPGCLNHYAPSAWSCDATSRWASGHPDRTCGCFVKGAPDALSARADRYLSESDVKPFDAAARDRHDRGNAVLAEQGMRVMAVGVRDFPADGWPPAQDPKGMLERLVLVALVGIVDPPRQEARRSIQECRDAGIRVRMLTGDHAVTAAAIAAELGIEGGAVTGAQAARSGHPVGYANHNRVQRGRRGRLPVVR